jgi:hypothetical protein
VKEGGIKDNKEVINNSANFKKRKITWPLKKKRSAKAYWRGKKDQG